MQFPLSQNELIILDRQMAMVARHLSEITLLLESRLGETNNSAISAKIIGAAFSSLADQIHDQAIHAGDEVSLASESQHA